MSLLPAGPPLHVCNMTYAVARPLKELVEQQCEQEVVPYLAEKLGFDETGDIRFEEFCASLDLVLAALLEPLELKDPSNTQPKVHI